MAKIKVDADAMWSTSTSRGGTWMGRLYINHHSNYGNILIYHRSSYITTQQEFCY